jgi:hypothetical protein
VLYVNGFPAWSNGGRAEMWAPRDASDYGDFMAAAVRRYPQVRRWIAFSEPTNYVNFRPQGGNGRVAPRLYARLLDAAYGAMHSVRRDVVVIGGNVHPAGFNDETTTAPDTFLRYLVLPNGRRPRLDMFGINPYTERPLNMRLQHRPRRIDFDDLDWLLRQLDRYWPRRHLRLFIDEFGWNTEHEAQGWLYHVSRRQQAARLRKAYALAANLRRVDTLCWFQLYDSPPDRNSTQWLNWTSGLRTWDGVKKPAWFAYGRVPSGPPHVRRLNVRRGSRTGRAAPPRTAQEHATRHAVTSRSMITARESGDTFGFHRDISQGVSGDERSRNRRIRLPGFAPRRSAASGRYRIVYRPPLGIRLDDCWG